MAPERLERYRENLRDELRWIAGELDAIERKARHSRDAVAGRHLGTARRLVEAARACVGSEDPEVSR